MSLGLRTDDGTFIAWADNDDVRGHDVARHRAESLGAVEKSGRRASKLVLASLGILYEKEH